MAITLGLAVTACKVEVEPDAAPAGPPTADEIEATELAPAVTPRDSTADDRELDSSTGEGPPDALAFSDPAATVTSPDGSPVPLRSGPDLTYSVLADLPDGTSVVPTGTGGASPSGAWLEVSFGGTTGFLPAAAVAGP